MPGRVAVGGSSQPGMIDDSPCGKIADGRVGEQDGVDRDGAAGEEAESDHLGLDSDSDQ